MSATTPRAAIYARVSTKGQADDGTSLDTQEVAARAHAAAHGYTVAAVYTETHTGTELWERPQLTALRTAMRARDVDVVICHAIDRLARDPVHLGVVLSEADHAGVEVTFVTEPLDDSPEGQLIRFVRGYAAKVEHEKIKERVHRGKAARVAAGKPHVGPRPPYGYQWADLDDKVRLVEDDVTAPIVRRIFREIAAGASTRSVAVRLSADGIPTPTGNAVWGKASISQMIANPAYTGNAAAYRYHRERIKGKGWRYTRRSVTDHVLLADVAPALVDSGLAAAALARLARNKVEATRNSRNPEAALLRAGIAVCGYCSCHLQAINHRTNGTFYRCNQTNRDAHGCPGFSIMAATLDAAIWEDVSARLLDRNLIARELDRLKAEDPGAADEAAVRRRLAEVERKQTNLVQRLADVDDPDVVTVIQGELANLSKEARHLNAERATIAGQRAAWQDAQQRLDDLDRWMQTVSLNLDTADYATRRLALTACKVKVQVWATDHDPRWKASMSLGEEPAVDVVATTSAGGTRARIGT